MWDFVDNINERIGIKRKEINDRGIGKGFVFLFEEWKKIKS